MGKVRERRRAPWAILLSMYTSIFEKVSRRYDKQIKKSDNGEISWRIENKEEIWKQS